MKPIRPVAVRVFGCVLLVMILPGGIATAQSGRTEEAELGALRAEVEALKRLLPSQSHAMADVDYHFSNLWFAAKRQNWALAEFYLNETRSHLGWTVRLRPVRRLASGQDFDLRPVLQGIEATGLAEIKASIERRDLGNFEAAYRNTMALCYGCHVAAEKPYLRPHIPETPATHMIDLRPAAGPARP
jgi:hypothetical protein